MNVDRIDHLVLTVRDIEATCSFYTSVLGMQLIEFGEGRKALSFGQQKINLHQFGNEFKPRAAAPTPGSADICLITNTSLDAVQQELESKGVQIIEGPVERTGATGSIVSLYLRDPDDNLIEISSYGDDGVEV